MFGKSRFFKNRTDRPEDLSDDELLKLFRREPDRAWNLFIKRYADHIYTQIRSLGFDYDEAMDRFVYVCEKLSENDFRRLLAVDHTGERGELIPWLRTVVKNLCINWAWSKEGRRRLFKSIEDLPPAEQKIFELYFWRGFSADEIYEQMRLDGQPDLKFISVLDSLERIFRALGRQNLWRLFCSLARRTGEDSLDQIEEETGLQPADERADAEETLLQKETVRRVNRALENLSTEERIAVRLHYVEKLTIGEVARLRRSSEREIKNALKTALRKLRRELE
ncbi:MAG: sigma factor-like helix-turn-helix DNA-binding protein [Pyrinomonadaceae bacterium]